MFERKNFNAEKLKRKKYLINLVILMKIFIQDIWLGIMKSIDFMIILMGSL